jgi:hypothetical protein
VLQFAPRTDNVKCDLHTLICQMYIFFLVRYLFRISPIFNRGIFFFSYEFLVCWFLQIFSLLYYLPTHFLHIVFFRAGVFNFKEVWFINYSFMDYVYCALSKCLCHI